MDITRMMDIKYRLQEMVEIPGQRYNLKLVIQDSMVQSIIQRTIPIHYVDSRDTHLMEQQLDLPIHLILRDG